MSDDATPPDRAGRPTTAPSTGADAWLPAATGGRGPRRARRVLAAALVLLVVLPAVYGVALVQHGNASITRVPVEGLTGSTADTTNILVVGSDSRADLTPEERNALTTGGDAGAERTDTILLLVIRGGDVAILSFPRDLWVERCDGTPQRINTAVQLGGLGCLARTVTATSGIGVDHVVQVSFGGFVQVVDAVGGVEVCLEKAISDRAAGIDLPSGCQTLDGPAALGFVRVRKIDDDLQRIRRQQQFLTALAKEVAQPANVLVPTRGWELVGALGSAVAADDGLGPGELLRLARAAQGLARGSALRATVPTTPTTINGASVLLEAADAPAVYEVFRNGSVLDAVGEAAGEAQPRSETRVVILNGAGVAGLAATTASALVDLGYPDAQLGNAERTRVTTVQHPPQLQAEAEQLADDLAGVLGVRPQVRAGAEGQAVTLLLGVDVDV